MDHASPPASQSFRPFVPRAPRPGAPRGCPPAHRLAASPLSFATSAAPSPFSAAHRVPSAPAASRLSSVSSGGESRPGTDRSAMAGARRAGGAARGGADTSCSGGSAWLAAVAEEAGRPGTGLRVGDVQVP